MDAPKHTPGPWVHYADLPSAEPSWHIITSANKMRVLANVHIEPGNTVDEANAALIAAAPDMFEALANLIPRFEAACRATGSDEEFVKAATEAHRAALAKATGG